MNLKIHKGDHVGIYGETGSGKSTLLDILIGLIPPSKGSILVDNFDIYKEKSAKLLDLKNCTRSSKIYTLKRCTRLLKILLMQNHLVKLILTY